MTTTSELLDAEACTLRERKKRQTRIAIHHAALDLVAKNGLSGVTVEAICVEADVATRTFFNYFPSKAAAALGLPTLRIRDDQRARFLADPDPDLVGGLSEIVISAFDGDGAMALGHDLAKGLVPEHPELLPAILQWMSDFRQEIVELASERTSLRQARLTATLVLGAMMEAIHDGARTRPALEEGISAAVRDMGELFALRPADAKH